jgi:hypothetical protein
MNYIVPTLNIELQQLTWISTLFCPKLFLCYKTILYQSQEKIKEAKTDYKATFCSMRYIHFILHNKFDLIKKLLRRKLGLQRRQCYDHGDNLCSSLYTKEIKWNIMGQAKRALRDRMTRAVWAGSVKMYRTPYNKRLTLMT